jgi:hypothetical protein
MGKPQSTGNLTNALAQDSSNNIGIGGSANASFKLQVTGATNLTGALSGTSATFSGLLSGGNSSPSLSYNAGSWFTGDGLVVGNISSVAGIQINSSTTSTLSAIRFGDGDGANNLYDQGFIIYNHSVDRMTLGANRSSIMHLVGGNVGIGTSSPSFILSLGGDSARTIGMNESTLGTAPSLTIRAADSSTGTNNEGGALFLSAGLGTGNGATSNIVFSTGAPLGSLTTRQTLTERMRITSVGQVQIKQGSNGFPDGLRLISTLGNRWTFVVGGDNNLYLGFNESGGGVFNSSTGGYTPLSDVNKKKDFEASTIGLSAILGLKPTLYRMKTDETEGNKELGFIAQEVKDFIPQAYSESINGDYTFIGLNYNAIVAALVKAIQELTQKVNALENK